MSEHQPGIRTEDILAESDPGLKTLGPLSFVILDILEKEPSDYGNREVVELLEDKRVICLRHIVQLGTTSSFYIRIRPSAVGKNADRPVHYTWNAFDPAIQGKNEPGPGGLGRKSSNQFSDKDVQTIEEVVTAVHRRRMERGVL